MSVTNYYTMAGRLLGEHATGAARLDYATDGKGNVIPVTNQSGQCNGRTPCPVRHDQSPP